MKGKKRFLRLSLVIVVAFIFSIGLATQGYCRTSKHSNPSEKAESGSLKIGFVDLNRIIKESKAAKNAQAIFKKEIESKQAMLKEKDNKITTINKEMNLKGTKPDSPAWKEKREKLSKEVNELNRLKNEYNRQIQKMDKELTQKILTDAMQIIKKIAGSGKYAIILDKRSSLFIEDGLDLTDKVIKMYDEQTK